MKRNFLALLVMATTAACERPTAPETEEPVRSPSFSLVQEVSVTDLGTLGGTSSSAFAVNDLGQVVGGWPALGESHAFLWEAGTMTELAGGHCAWRVNTLGQVVGNGRTVVGHVHAFLWQAGTAIDLGTLGGDVSSVGCGARLGSEVFVPSGGINNLGQAVGTSETATGEFHAFLWQAGALTDLGTLGGSFSGAQAINDVGQVVGVSRTAAGHLHAFLWEAGTLTDLGTLGGERSFPKSINVLGQVVGQSETQGGEFHAFLWQAGVMSDLGTLGGSGSAATAINNVGQVVGWSTTAAGVFHAVLWEAGTMTDLGTVGGGRSDASAVNDLGQVVGQGRRAPDADAYAFLWQAGTMTDLGGLGGTGSFAAAGGINRLGQVVGSARNVAGDIHAALWTTLRPATPEEEVTVIEDAVTDLVGDGSLSDGQSQPLVASLDAATRLLNDGNAAGAARLLEAFVRQVDAFVRAGILSAEDGDRLTTAARNAIEQLSATP